PRVLAAAESAATPSPNRLDAWLRIDREGNVHVFTGKAEIGMGVETGLTQIVAEELDVPVARVIFVMGDTSTTADQGGVGGSTSIAMGSKPLRHVAATARALLVRLAAKNLGASPEELQVREGVVSVKADPSRKISYAELAASGDLDEALKVSGEGFALNVEGLGKPKDPSSYTVVGQPIPRVDIAPKILGKWQYVTDVRGPGMLHGRVIRPAGVGAKLMGFDDSAANKIPGYVQTVTKGDFVCLGAESEWAAVRAAKALRVNWSAPEQAFPVQKDLYQHMRSAAPKATKETLKKGDAAGVLAPAAKKVQASYEAPFQSHATMGPGCAVADVHTDGVSTIWSGGQKPHALQKGFAELLGAPRDKARVFWVKDAGPSGRPGSEDTAADAVLLSQAVGKPVRVQWSRADMTAWGSKGPAVVYDLAAAIDEHREITAVDFTSRAFSGGEV